jgi:tetratricopeptide (TPR) repeat protein
LRVVGAGWKRLSPFRRRVIASLATVMLLVGTWDRFRPTSEHPTPMTGDVNVAVAEFASLRPDGDVAVTEESRALASSVHDALRDDLIEMEQSGDADASIDYEVQAPDVTGPIDGETAEERAAQADQIGSRFSADIVVYAVIDVRPDATSTTPEFYLTDRNLVVGAEELIGQYRLGNALAEPGHISNVNVRSRLREGLLARTSGLIHLVIGLSYFELQEYDSALEVFDDIESNGGISHDDGGEVLHLFWGNAAGRLGDLQLAEEQYQLALDINPEYARARVGLAETMYQRSYNDCTSDAVDAEGVQQALHGYQSALTADDRPARSNIESKVSLGVGRAHLCLSIARVEDSWAKAETELRRVANAYENGNTEIEELAAEAYSGLGLMEIETVVDRGGNLERAITNLKRAITIAEADPASNRQYIWYGFLGYAHCQLGQTPEALDSYDHAFRLAPEEKQRQYTEARERAALEDPARC